MTTVAAVARDGHVWMAADSCNNVHQRPIVDGARKLVRIVVEGRPLILGVTGAGCIAAICRRRLSTGQVGSWPETVAGAQAWADRVASTITDLLRDHHVINEEGQIDGALLLGALGRVWTLTDHQAIPHPTGIAAIGSGDELAIGALYALDDLLDPPAALDRALAIACAHDRYSEEPIYIEHVDEERFYAHPAAAGRA